LINYLSLQFIFLISSFTKLHSFSSVEFMGLFMLLYFENSNFMIIDFEYYVQAEEFEARVANLQKLKPRFKLFQISKCLVCTLSTRLVLFIYQ
jgi:hypothetical protein